MDTKKCYGCQTEKLLQDFCRDKLGVGEYKNYCRECQRVQRKIYSMKNKHKEKEYNKLYKATHKEECKEYGKKWREENPDKVKSRKRRYYIQNRKKPKFVIESAITGAIRKRIAYNRSMGRLQEILGYTTEELMVHLEAKFSPKMNWKNYGTYWHIDHKRPKSWFSYQSTEDKEFRDCWALSNLQPLEASINTSKQNRYEG